MENSFSHWFNDSYLTNHSWLKRFSGGVCELKEQEEIINMLIAFCAAGLKAQEYIHPLEQDE